MGGSRSGVSSCGLWSPLPLAIFVTLDELLPLWASVSTSEQHKRWF